MKRKILQHILRKITKRIIKKYNPLIVAVTGSVGKTSTKDAIYTTLNKYKNSRKSSGNLNTEVGAPLVFLGVDEAGKDWKEWLTILWKGLKLILKKDKNYPEVIVMEMAADHRGDIDYLTSFIKPHISAVTAIGETPVHLEFYENVNEIVKEKSILVRETKKGGSVILNADDGRVFQMKGRAKTTVKTFGFSDRAEIRAKDLKLTGNKNNPAGVEFTLNYDTEEHKVELPNVFDRGSVYSVLIAIGVGIAAGIPVYRLVESCKGYTPPKGRMRFIEGEKCLIIDSTYNAAPKSVELALETVNKLEAKRKVAVLGDMLELGEASKETHRQIGDKVQFLDVLITIGKDSKEIQNKFNKEKYHFENSEEAAGKIENIIKDNDLVLVKGSQSIRTEKVVERIMKEKPDDLLVRQYYPWKTNEENKKEV